MPRRRLGQSATFCAIAFISMGIMYRGYLTCILPVGYDEVKVIAVGLEEMRESPGRALIEVPIRHSSAMTPLWWWIQYACTAGGRVISLLTIRIAPVMLGVVTLLVGYRACAARWGRSTGVVFAGWLALSDVLTFTNSRGDFAESLMVCLLVPLTCMVGRRDVAARRGMLWLGLLMTGLGKGVFAIGLMLIAEVVVLAVGGGRGSKSEEPRGPKPAARWAARGLAVSLLIAAVPTLAYLSIAASYFSDAESIQHDAVEATGVLDLAWQLTANYADIKAHVTGSALDAALVWWDWDAWPVTVVSGLLIALAIVLAIRRWSGGLGSRRSGVMLALLAWSVCGAAVVISRGTAGARFHLMYLPALWLFASLVMPVRLNRLAGRIVISAIPVVWLICVSLAGPVSWASFARFEPMHGQDELEKLRAWRDQRAPKPSPHGRTLYIDLAHHYLTIQPRSQADVDRAIHFARKESAATPGDARAWFYLGDALQQRGGLLDDACDAWKTGLGIQAHPAVEQKFIEHCGER